MTDVPLPDMPDGPSPEAMILMGLRKRYLDLAAQAYEISVEVDRIKAHVRRLGRGQHAVGEGSITISPNRTFSPKLAEKVLSDIHPDLVEKCSVSRIDAKLTREYVSGEIYAQCQNESGDDKVVIS